MVRYVAFCIAKVTPFSRRSDTRISCSYREVAQNKDRDVSRYFSQIAHSVASLLYYTTNKKTNNFLLRLVTQNNDSIIIKRTLKSTEGLHQTVRGKKEREREKEK